MRKFSPFFLIVFFLCYHSLFAYEYPTPESDELIVLTLSQKQIDSLCSWRNYSAKCSPEGVCYGIDRINYTLLTKIQFLPGKKDPYKVIKVKLLCAFFGLQQTIYGYTSPQGFLKEMNRTWYWTSNPLRLAIETIQISQDSFDLYEQSWRRISQVATQGPYVVSEEEAFKFEQSILEGIPLHIGIYDPKIGTHALTIVGFKRTLSSQELTNEFLVLDSNLPTELQILYHEDDKWYYEPWEEYPRRYVYLIWGPPSQEEVDLAKSTFSPHFLFGDQVPPLHLVYY